MSGSDLYVGGVFTQTADGAVTNLNYIAKFTIGSPPTCNVKPSKPKLKAPADDAAVTNTRPTLKWKQTNCAETYNVIVKDAATGKTVEKKQGLDATTLKYKFAKALTQGKTYKWFVEAKNGAGKTKSETRTFTVK